ncbi:MAG: AMP-binding protein [Rubrivivax sp.]|nr:AMP-binding protein [Rubrivivax sp.]
MNAHAPGAMAPRQQSPLLAADTWMAQVAVLGGARSWSWWQVHAAARALASELPDGATVCNLCRSRAGFLVVWLAALRRRCLLVLPPSGGRADLAAVLAACHRPVVLFDEPADLQPEWAAMAPCRLFQPEPDLGAPAGTGLSWSPAWDAPLIRLYTSGSTGLPEPQVKTLGCLERGAQTLGERLGQEIEGGLPMLRRIVCSVPTQHMFGVEAAVMLSLVHGLPLVERHPLLPADVRSACAAAGDGVVWVTTPLHLRALVRSGTQVPNCSAVIVSTMPLAAAVAVQAEGLLGAPVLEIYGTTETGALAMRRGATQTDWTPLAGVELSPSPDGALAWGGHFDSPQRLADQIELGHGSFRLLGRQSDLIKIAGRRASLAGLNLLLQDMPGPDDACFYLPHTGADAERLVLIHAGAPLDTAAVRAWLRRHMDPVFLPRAFIQVARLPRTEGGKLPQEALRRIHAAWLAGSVEP